MGDELGRKAPPPEGAHEKKYTQFLCYSSGLPEFQKVSFLSSLVRDVRIFIGHGTKNIWIEMPLFGNSVKSEK